MLGYKGMDKDMKCRGFQYEVGKTYSIDGEPKLCKEGFHFCKNLEAVYDYYRKDGHNRFFVVEGIGDFKENYSKVVTNKIKIIREITKEEENRVVYSDGNGDGDCYGYGDGDGYCYGNGYGYGYGYGKGYGKGDGDGYGKGKGDGNGNGYGYGDGDGDGYGDGDCYGYGDGDGYCYGENNVQKILVFCGMEHFSP